MTPRVRSPIGRRTLHLIVAFGFSLVCATAAHSQPALPFKVEADIPLPGSSSRLDYASLDPKTHLLFVAHMAAGSVVAFDVARNRVAGTIEGTPTVRGVLAVPSLARAYAAAQGSGEVVAIDERTLQTIARIGNAGDVDGLAFDPKTARVFVSDEGGGNDVVIDTKTNRIIGKVPLGGEAGNTQYAITSGKIYVAVQTRNELVEIDPRWLKIDRRYDLEGCRHGHGFAIDDRRQLAYVACEGNAALITLDLRTGHIVAKNVVGDGPDVVAIDASRERLYVAAESGVMATFDISSPTPKSLAVRFLAPHAHVVAVDESTHRLFFPLQEVGGKPVLRIAREI